MGLESLVGARITKVDAHSMREMVEDDHPTCNPFYVGVAFTMTLEDGRDVVFGTLYNEPTIDIEIVGTATTKESN